MAFSIRKMFSNISYFKKSDNNELEGTKIRRSTYNSTFEETDAINYESTEPDSTSRQCTSLNIPDSVKKFNAKKASLSDTDLLSISVDSPIRHKRKKCKKLKVDIKKASQSMSGRLNQTNEDNSSSTNVENTPKHILLECVSSGVFTDKLKGFDFSKEFDIYDGTSDDQWSNPFEEENYEIESLSDHSDSEVSVNLNKKKSIKMCRKVESIHSGSSSENEFIPAATPESFGEIEIDKSEEERMKLLHNYQSKLEKVECFLKDMLNEFQFHIEVSKIFNSRDLPTEQQRPDDTDAINARKASPTDSWSVIMEKQDDNTKISVKQQLESIKQSIEQFINIYLRNYEAGPPNRKCRKYLSRRERSSTFDNTKGPHMLAKRVHMNNKKKIKHYDFPDLREAMINLFYPQSNDISISNVTSDTDESISSKCSCNCHHETSSAHTDSGLTSKTNELSLSNQSITSSIGNFSLDTSTLTAYSESLDQIVSYNSFQDTSLYNTFLQKSALERITFYIQVHSIQLKSEASEQDLESKNILTFYCPSCKTTDYDENSVFKHIISQYHCEKIHFQYKTIYIKKCMAEGKEIQPSTVLNPMKMYRDDNKIVCFGNAVYACSLCFENLLVGESVLMAHCAENEHIQRREKLGDVLD